MGKAFPSTKTSITILGASARAAAFSCLRAGLQPWCADLFGDLDLRQRCPFSVSTLGRREYPQGLRRVLESAPPGPWIYTGGLENRPGLIAELSRIRVLWGNGPASLARARCPFTIATTLRLHGIPRPRVYADARDLPGEGTWLIKPLAGTGGTGIRFLRDSRRQKSAAKPIYFQEYMDGESISAIHVGNGIAAQTIGLGCTRQLVGEGWLHAAPFQYCGSIGPIHISVSQRTQLARICHILAGACPLRGIFGVDFILHNDIPLPIEINPRYTASVEVLEHALNYPAITAHRCVFEPDERIASGSLTPSSAGTPHCCGKAILFARDTLDFPADGPWVNELRSPVPIDQLPAFADIPGAGQRIEAHQPILTFFAKGASAHACLDSLKQIAAGLDQWLYGT
jgi:predicted ATP-grasp superfamily ATP-dependent carboligase